jgi:hypothetical protein
MAKGEWNEKHDYERMGLDKNYKSIPNQVLIYYIGGEHYYTTIHSDSKHKWTIGKRSKCRPYNSNINNCEWMFASFYFLVR